MEGLNPVESRLAALGGLSCQAAHTANQPQYCSGQPTSVAYLPIPARQPYPQK